MITNGGDKVTIRVVTKWVDPSTGRRRQWTKAFSQTINSRNLGSDGQPKTREQILCELRSEQDRWLLSPNSLPDSLVGAR